MSNKQVLVYGVLESTNDLRSVFVGHIHFKKLMKFQKYSRVWVFLYNANTQEPFLETKICLPRICLTQKRLEEWGSN